MRSLIQIWCRNLAVTRSRSGHDLEGPGFGSSNFSRALVRSRSPGFKTNQACIRGSVCRVRTWTFSHTEINLKHLLYTQHYKFCRALSGLYLLFVTGEGYHSCRTTVMALVENWYGSFQLILRNFSDFEE